MITAGREFVRAIGSLLGCFLTAVPGGRAVPDPERRPWAIAIANRSAGSIFRQRIGSATFLQRLACCLEFSLQLSAVTFKFFNIRWSSRERKLPALEGARQVFNLSLERRDPILVVLTHIQNACPCLPRLEAICCFGPRHNGDPTLRETVAIEVVAKSNAKAARWSSGRPWAVVDFTGRPLVLVFRLAVQKNRIFAQRRIIDEAAS